VPTDANTVFRGADLSMVQSAFRAALAKQPTTAAARGTQSATHVGGPHPQTEDFNTALEAVSTGQPIPATMSDGQIIDQCAKLGAELAWAKVTGNQAHAAQLETALAFGTCDPLWTEVAVEYEAFKLSKQPIPYRGYGGDLSKFVLPLPAGDANGIRIGIFADWGTGTSDAVNLLTAILAQSPHVLIHLGDIYYPRTR